MKEKIHFGAIVDAADGLPNDIRNDTDRLIKLIHQYAEQQLDDIDRLRDEIAIAVLNGMESIEDDSTYGTPNLLTLDEWRKGKRELKATYAYEMADTMLRLRSQYV